MDLKSIRNNKTWISDKMYNRTKVFLEGNGKGQRSEMHLYG